MTAGARLACGLFLVVAMLSGCRPVGGPGAGGSGAGGSGSRAGRCTLTSAAFGSLSRQMISAPGPARANVPRTYWLYVPTGIGRASSVPLLVSLHGFGANGAIQNAATGWSAFDNARAAAGSPFMLVLPDGLRSLWFWGAERSYDVRFVFAVIARIRASGCVNPQQIYVDGWSEGAFMAQRMACANGDPAVDVQGIRLAGVASYAGGYPAVLLTAGPVTGRCCPAGSCCLRASRTR